MGQNVKLDQIKFDKSNANKGTERGRYAIESSIREFGFADAGTLDKNNVIIGGNKRTEVVGEIGMDEAIIVDVDGTKPVYIRRNDLDLYATDDDRARRLAYALNRSGQLSLEWDAEQLFSDLNAGVDLSGMFFDDEIADILATIDGYEKETAGEDPGADVSKADELQTKWNVQLGDLWQLGDHRLICGDCTDEATVSRVMGGEKAALMATDPPYGVAYTVETGVGSKFGAIANDENDGPRLQLFLESSFRVAKTALLDNAAWYLWHAQMTQGFFAAAAAAAAVIIHRQIIWVKPSLVLGHGDYHWRHELCFYGWVEGNRPPWYGDRKQTTVWEIGRENDGVHPTQKPVEIFERPLQFNTKPGDIAYEPFCGSGSQIIACEQLGRKCRAVELHPPYVSVALERFFTMTGKTPTRIT